MEKIIAFEAAGRTDNTGDSRWEKAFHVDI